ncbi:hypothetical protein PoB_001671400 [Plakobranchus ocellatus]|uniref:Uncharacterized protein n=1 Tax=Plakobranchus ocellatus TaxID=259542 RepID=A0AAV3Z4I4_9GAST|nr:hypothetical protein PoB_001671400 [Plakobranchus ocellatus]
MNLTQQLMELFGQGGLSKQTILCGGENGPIERLDWWKMPGKDGCVSSTSRQRKAGVISLWRAVSPLFCQQERNISARQTKGDNADTFALPELVLVRAKSPLSWKTNENTLLFYREKHGGLIT